MLWYIKRFILKLKIIFYIVSVLIIEYIYYIIIFSHENHIYLGSDIFIGLLFRVVK